MRRILDCSLDNGEYGGDCPSCEHLVGEILEDIAECKRDEYAEANELLKALNMEPIEVPDHYTEGYCDYWAEAAELRRQQPPVHTCRISTEMEVKGVLDSLKATLNDCESD